MGKSMTLEDFIKKSNEKHNYKYNYDKTVYVNAQTRVIVTCPVHGIFEQTPDKHLSGRGCQACAAEARVRSFRRNENSFSCSGFKTIANDRQCTFYIIKCFNENEEFYKIGITSGTVRKRYVGKKTMPYMYEIIKEIYGDAESIWTLENNLKKKLTSNYSPKIDFAGSVRECYSDLEEILKSL